MNHEHDEAHQNKARETQPGPKEHGKAERDLHASDMTFDAKG